MQSPAMIQSLRMLVLAAAWLLPAAWAWAGPWWSSDWTYRRSVAVDHFTPTRLPGDDIAVVTFLTGGLARPDGADIRLVAPGDREMPVRVLSTGPGDAMTVAFAVLPDVTRYDLYLGNKNAKAGKELSIRRGVLMESWLYESGLAKTVPQVRDLLAKPGPLQGRRFVENIFLGYNPFGAEEKLLSVFTGHLNVTRGGEHVFATSSRNASFLLIDGELVVDNGGFHEPQKRASETGKVNLTTGLHTLTFYHVTNGGAPVVVAAWQVPGGRRPVPILPGAFAPVFQARAGPLERYNAPVTVDYTVKHAGETFVGNRYCQRLVFEAVLAGQAQSVSFHWDFGDGQTSDRPVHEHVYLAAGEYKVTLKARTYAGELVMTNRIVVDRPWERVVDGKLDEIRDHAAIVARYDFAKLPPAAIQQAATLLARASRDADVIRLGEQFQPRGKVWPRLVERVMDEYAQALVRQGRAAQAVKELQRGEAMTQDPAVLAGLGVRRASILLHELDDASAALSAYEAVLKTQGALTTDGAIRRAKIGLGDALLAKGDLENARKAYEQAGLGPEAASAKLPVLRGDYARQVEAYLAQNDLESAQDRLDAWENCIPADKLEGYTALLRCRLLEALKQPAASARAAMRLVEANPGSAYAPQLLMMAADNFKASAQAPKARAALERLADHYPESPLAAQARKTLGPK